MTKTKEGELRYGNRSPDVLGEQNALSLNDNEVDQLVDVTDRGFEGLAGDGVVFAWTELARESGVHDGLTGDLGCDSDAKNHPGELEAPSDDIEVPNREDEAHDGGIRDGRSTCSLLSVRRVCRRRSRDIRTRVVP